MTKTTNNMKRTILIGMLSVTMLAQTKAQHFYYKLDVGTSNIYSFAISNIATAWLNKLTNTMLFDNAYTYTHLNTTGQADRYKTRNYDVTGITARDIFADITTGGKLGYQTFRPGAFNWGLFGSAHYRINQFKNTYEQLDGYLHNNLKRLQLGGGLLLNIGRITSATHVIVEAGLRYDIPIKYNTSTGTVPTGNLRKGLTSHYAIRINGRGALQGLGLYADVPHYKLFKETNTAANIRTYTFGFIYTITPWKI